MVETVLSAQNIIKRFPQGESEVEILHGISLDLSEGEIVAIIGPRPIHHLIVPRIVVTARFGNFFQYAPRLKNRFFISGA